MAITQLIRACALFLAFAVSVSAHPAEYDAFPRLQSRDEMIASELGPKLSPGAEIIMPSNPGFVDATTRWQVYREPNISVVVSVATERDIQQTVLYANQHNISFLATGGAHGFITTLGNVHNGIQIWTRNMKNITISNDNHSVKIGPGALSGEVRNALTAVGKRTATGNCECTGMAGPTLGGGHGWLQGNYGLVADNLLEARMVLANGSLVTVSNSSNTDLFWAIRGAGHNFGIVTEFTNRVYDDLSAPSQRFFYERFAFGEDKVEAVFEQINRMQNDPDSKPPVELTHFAFYTRVPGLNDGNMVVLLWIIYEGSAAQEKAYGAPYHALGPLQVTSDSVTLAGLAQATFNGANQSTCVDGNAVQQFPIGLARYNTTSQRAVFDYFANFTAQRPEFNTSVFLFEGYATQGVRAVPEASTAFPNRLTDNMLVSPDLVYESAGPERDQAATKAGEEMRRMLHDGSGSDELHAYVNYAHGDESLQMMYGYEPWRVERLRRLKREYDPEGRFNFYAPITY